MTLEFEITVDDIWALTWESQRPRHERFARRCFCAILTLGLAGFLTALAYGILRGDLGPIGKTVGVCSVLLALVGAVGVRGLVAGPLKPPKLTERKRRKLIEGVQRTGPIAPVRLVFKEDGLIDEGGSHPMGFIPWRNVHKLIEAADHMFIFTQPNRGFIIPKRVLPDPTMTMKAIHELYARAVFA
jgi:hypothetical protein